MRPFGLRIWLLIMFLGSGTVAQAELILSAPPRETPAAGEKLYGPLARHLSRLLNQTVVYQHPKGWLNYQRKLRDKAYDLVFDGPHFVSWRMVHNDHQPLVKLPASLQFYVVTRESNAEVRGLDDLITRRVCALAPPHLGTLLLYSRFPDPVLQPLIQEVRGGFKAVFNALMQERCDAAVLRSLFYDKALSDSDRDALRVVHRGPTLPNQALTAGPAIGGEQQATIVQSLTAEPAGLAATEALRQRFDKPAALVPASAWEYQDYNRLLEDEAFGW